MTTNRIALVIIAIVIAAGFTASLFKIQLAQALADATSSTTTDQTINTSTSSPPTTTTTSSTTDQTTTTTPAPMTAPSTAPLTLVHIVGTKYIDYCTNGTKITAYPGDPAIDSHFNVPNAPTPKCPNGQTWDHTSGMDKFDTTSGDLDAGDYAQQADGTYIVHFAASTYTDATSTSQWPDRIASMNADPSLGVSASSVQAPTVSSPSSTASSTQ